MAAKVSIRNNAHPLLGDEPRPLASHARARAHNVPYLAFSEVTIFTTLQH